MIESILLLSTVASLIYSCGKKYFSGCNSQIIHQDDASIDAFQSVNGCASKLMNVILDGPIIYCKNCRRILGYVDENGIAHLHGVRLLKYEPLNVRIIGGKKIMAVSISENISNKRKCPVDGFDPMDEPNSKRQKTVITSGHFHVTLDSSKELESYVDTDSSASYSSVNEVSTRAAFELDRDSFTFEDNDDFFTTNYPENTGRSVNFDDSTIPVFSPPIYISSPRLSPYYFGNPNARYSRYNLNASTISISSEETDESIPPLIMSENRNTSIISISSDEEDEEINQEFQDDYIYDDGVRSLSPTEIVNSTFIYGDRYDSEGCSIFSGSPISGSPAYSITDPIEQNVSLPYAYPLVSYTSTPSPRRIYDEEILISVNTMPLEHYTGVESNATAVVDQYNNFVSEEMLNEFDSIFDAPCSPTSDIVGVIDEIMSGMTDEEVNFVTQLGQQLMESFDEL